MNLASSVCLRHNRLQAHHGLLKICRSRNDHRLLCDRRVGYLVSGQDLRVNPYPVCGIVYDAEARITLLESPNGRR
eukprot:10372778-Karenia_brevis.AAC.1